MREPLKQMLSPWIEGRWERFALEHPHLAQAIDRIALEDVVVDMIRDDPAYQQALVDAEIDERTLAAAANVLQKVQLVVDRILKI